MKNSKIIGLLLIAVFAFAIRFLIIGFGLPSRNMALTTYNPDEPLSYYTIEQWNPKKLDFHPHRVFLWGGFHLFPLAASLGIGKIFGYVKIGNRQFYINNLSEADKLYIVGRLLMIVCAVISVFLIFLVLKETYNENVGLLGALLLAISPAHIFNSIYVRPDIMMMTFGLLSMYFSVLLLKTGNTKFYVLAALAVGFAAGAKIIGGVYAVVPITAHFLKKEVLQEKIKDIRLFLLPVFCLIFFLISSPYSIIDFNATQESFWHYFKTNMMLSKGTMEPGQLILFGHGPLSYLKYYLTIGFGGVMVSTGIIGFFLILMTFLDGKRNYFDILFLLSGITILIVISAPKNQVIWYTFPFLPFLIIFCVRGIYILSQLLKNNLAKPMLLILTCVLFGYTSIYACSYWKLYFQMNVREIASEWIEKNIPKGSSIAIARSYFWTPPILRQYSPPYKLLMGGDFINSSIDEAVSGLEKILPQAEYVVLTEYEYRLFKNELVSDHFPEQQKVIQHMFSKKTFEIVREFSFEAKCMGMKFAHKYPPSDWLIPNPKIIVFKRIGEESDPQKN